MEIQNRDGLQYVTFHNIEGTGLVNHCFTTRLGGVSKGVYGELNLSFTRGESRDAVFENYRILSEKLGFDYNGFVLSHQTHTTNIRHVTERERGMGLTKESDIRDTDGLITNIPGIHLTIFGADCVPIFLLDPVKKVIAAVHAGWRGSVNGIAAKVVAEMIEDYGVDAENILVGIGPSIGKCCFQVDEPVVALFHEKLDFADEVIFKDTSEDGKYKIDLWQTNKRILMTAGVKEGNIEISGICTRCHTDLFYSHRKTGSARGNMAGVLSLK